MSAAPGYSAPDASSVYALAPPDPEPLPRRTRLALVWDGDACTEIEPDPIPATSAPGARLRAAESPGATQDRATEESLSP